MLTVNGKGKEVAELFRKFGLNEYESRVYFTLQVNGKTKAGRLWQSAGVPQNKGYHSIQTVSKCSLYEIQEKIDGYREVSKNSKLVRVVV